MFENWQHNKNLDFFHYLKVPHFFREDSLAYYEGEMELLRDHIADYFSIEISDEALEEAIEVREKVRAKWRELSKLREMEEPPISGSEAISLMVTGSSMRSEDFLELLSRLIDERKDAPGNKPKVRLMLCGPATDEVDWFEEIEHLGGMMVADTLCFGARAFNQTTKAEGGPIHRLAVNYLDNLFCPRMYTEYKKRRDFMIDTAERAKVDGAIVLYNKFCDLHGVDAVLIHRDLEEKGIPVLILEKEYSAAADLGRIKTRVQAFIERIGGGV
jgi:benzoyl-CoA reductase/2-hydroxyglutaryl-CoA dehydratase subunit BcrC/BadD/HgdB